MRTRWSFHAVLRAAAVCGAVVARARRGAVARRAAVALVGALAVLAPAAERSAAQEPVLLERIVAIVDEEMILQSDLDLAVELYQLDRQLTGLPPEPETPALRTQVLESLIENKLIIAAAKQHDMVVEEADVEARVEDRVQQLIAQYGSLAALEQALAASGLSLEDFRFRYGTQLRNQQYLRLVVGRFIRPYIEVMANEVEAYYLDNLADMPAEPDSLTVSSILVRVQPSVESRRAVQAKVERVQQALAAGRPFAEVAREFSEGPNAQRGGRIGAVRPGDLFDRVLDQTVAKLTEGEVSAPVVSTRGVHIIRLDRLEADGARVISQVFFPIEIQEADVAVARRRIEAARQRVLDGEPFSLVAAEVSEDPAAASTGGVLGTFQLDELSPAFQEALTGAMIGQVTEPLLTSAGWYVFQVLDRIEGHRYTFAELRDDLRRFVEGQKIEAELASYIETLSDRFFVDIKD
jgi:peptidyl-prolyl cis-trans isomerase SurA